MIIIEIGPMPQARADRIEHALDQCSALNGADWGFVRSDMTGVSGAASSELALLIKQIIERTT